jgi:superfamily II DNA or RNA helicase
MQLRPHQQVGLDALSKYNKGQVIVPTGGGKTLIAIMDAVRRLKDENKTIVVVAPRILLADQLSSEFLEHISNVSVLHVHSGKTHHDSTTNPETIRWWVDKNEGNKLIFTTYHSLHRIQESDISVDTIYFDEAHNSVQKNFIESVEYFSIYAKRCYFFTATPKHSLTPMKAGMNDGDIFGQVICNVPAPELVEQGYILPPKVSVKKLPELDDSRFKYEHECDHVLETIDEHNTDKILICAKSTRQITQFVSLTKFVDELSTRGYSYMYITSKTGAVINGEKVSREEFFNTLNAWGKGDERFVVLHHSILSEGINVKGLESVLFLRNMDYIGISQTIGRVIRIGKKEKTHGLICVPVCGKVGISTARKVEAVVCTVFDKGEPAISTIRR